MNETPNRTTERVSVVLVVFTFTDLLVSEQHASRMLSPNLLRRAHAAVDFLRSGVEPGWPSPYSELFNLENTRVRLVYALDPAAAYELIERAGIALDYGFSDMGVAVTLDEICTSTLPIVSGSEPGIVTRAMLEGFAALLPEEPED